MGSKKQHNMNYEMQFMVKKILDRGVTGVEEIDEGTSDTTGERRISF